MPIIDMQRRLHEAGRIRIGKAVAAGKGKRPAKLETFRFTSQSEDTIKVMAKLFGGEVKPWEDAPTGKQWEVISDASDMRVMVPPEAMGFSQFYELWKAGGCERRCDGVTQVGTEQPCACDPEERECKPHTRLSVMLQQMPTSGLWRLDTSGFYAAAELSGGFELARLIAQSSGRSVLGASLRLEQRGVKRKGETVKRFAVPVLDFDIDPATLVGQESAERLSGVGAVPALLPPTLKEQLDQVDTPVEKPTRANGAEPIKPTGLKPKGAMVIEPSEEPAAPSEDQNVTTASTGGVDVAEFAKYFEELKRRVPTAKIKAVLAGHGWTQGTKLSDWTASQTSETINRLWAELIQLEAPK